MFLFFFYFRGQSGDDCARDVPRGPRSRAGLRVPVHRFLLHPRGAAGRAARAERGGGVRGEQEGVHRIRQVEND